MCSDPLCPENDIQIYLHSLKSQRSRLEVLQANGRTVTQRKASACERARGNSGKEL